MSEPRLPEGSVVLVVDDDERLRARLTWAVSDRGYEVGAASGPTEALAVARELRPTHAILDLRMPDGSGLELLAELLQLLPALQCVMFTGYGSIATAVEAVRRGAVNYLSKPADLDMILAAFQRRKPGTAEPAPYYEPPSLARAEWEHINRVLEDCGGNVSEAARRLGLHRRSLQRKLRRFPPRK